MPEQPPLESGYDFNEKLSKLENLLKDQYAIEFYLWMKNNEERIKNGKKITDEDLLKEFKKQKDYENRI
jgi:hypothetical protein